MNTARESIAKLFLQARFNHAPERRHEKSTGLHLSGLAELVKSYVALLIGAGETRPM